MLRTLPARARTPQRCVCSQRRRQAHLSSAPSASTSAAFILPSPPSTSSPPEPPLADPTYHDPSYLARYRSPEAHDRPLLRPTLLTSRSRYSPIVGSPPPPPTSSAPQPYIRGRASRDNGKRKDQDSETPRSRRLEMERLWSGGEFSPPIPLDNYRAAAGAQAHKHAVLFPGTGSQYVGMGHFLKEFSAAKNVWEEADDALESFEEWRKSLKLDQMEGEMGQLGRMMDESEGERKREKKLREVVFVGPQDELNRSANSQPAILITSIAFLRTLEDNLATPVASSAAYFLGHSSGEYSAAVGSDAISLADGVRLTRLHGVLTSCALALPSIALSASPSAPDLSRAQMSALVINPGHSHQELADVIRSFTPPEGSKGSQGTVEVASYNSSAQVVLSGSREGIMKASEELRERGIAVRAADLPVSAPFHCSFMKPAAAAMQTALEAIKINDPRAPIVSGLDGNLITKPSSLISNIVDQISLPVRWAHCLRTLRHTEASRLIFLGPGKALANLARRDTGLEGDKGEKQVVMSVATQDDLDRVRKVFADEEP